METKGATFSARRSGAATRMQILRTALRLFIEQSYEATSLRQIADEVGINKASLYYYFDSKQAILDAAFENRGDEATDLLAWLAQEPRSPGLVTAAVMRWVDTYSTDKLQGIRFMAANPHLTGGNFGGPKAQRIATGLSRFADELTGLLPNPSPENAVLLRMALLSINAAVQAGAQSDYPDEAVVSAAKRAALALLAEVDHTV